MHVELELTVRARGLRRCRGPRCIFGFDAGRSVPNHFGAWISPRLLHSAEYRRPGDIPAGPVLVVGAGNSGRQIAEELAATPSVTLAVGAESLQLPQRLLGRDLFWWLTRLGGDHEDRQVMAGAPDAGPRRPGHRAPLRRLRGVGVTVRSRAVSITANEVSFRVGPVARVATVVWATGFRADHSWICVPGVLDENGRPRHQRGITAVPGLAFVGLPWQHTRGSALLGFVQHDAAWVAGRLEAQRFEDLVGRELSPV